MKIPATIIGAALCVTALTGFVAPTIFNMALNPTHNFFLLSMGLLSLYMGTKGSEAHARRTLQILGAMFTILGAVTLFAPSGVAFPDSLNLQSEHVLKLIPGHLEYTTSDGVRDLLMGLVAFALGVMPRRRIAEQIPSSETLSRANQQTAAQR